MLSIAEALAGPLTQLHAVNRLQPKSNPSASTVSRYRFSLECERLASEVARQKPYIRDLEWAAAAARTAQRQSDEAAALLQRQLGQMRQAQQQEVEALAAELSKARHSVR
jgi:hypothetical protein